MLLTLKNRLINSNDVVLWQWDEECMKYSRNFNWLIGKSLAFSFIAYESNCLASSHITSTTQPTSMWSRCSDMESETWISSLSSSSFFSHLHHYLIMNIILQSWFSHRDTLTYSFFKVIIKSTTKWTEKCLVLSVQRSWLQKSQPNSNNNLFIVVVERWLSGMESEHVHTVNENGNAEKSQRVFVSTWLDFWCYARWW